MEAGIVVAALEENGIRSTMTGAATAGFRAEAPGWVHVLVAEEDLPQAEALLEEIGHSQDDVDWSQVDVGQPEDKEIPDEVSAWTRRRYWSTIGYLVAVVLISIFIAAMLRTMIALISGV